MGVGASGPMLVQVPLQDVVLVCCNQYQASQEPHDHLDLWRGLTVEDEMALVLADAVVIVLVTEVVDVLQGGRQCWHCAGPNPDSSTCSVTSTSEQNGPEAARLSIGGN